MARTNLFREPVILLIACAVVGLLAAQSVFASIMGFPWIFALVCLGVGLLSLRRQPRVSLGPRLAVILLGPTLAVAGFWVHLKSVEQHLDALQKEVSAALTGTDAPRLTGMQALNVEPAALEQAASYSSPATIVTFWARWCSPCWKELPELDDFYRRHAKSGLAVVALTRYDEPDDAARQSELAKARDFVRDRGLTFPAAITTDADVYRGFMVRSLPSAALIDGNGKIVAYGVGVEGSRELMQRARALMQGVSIARHASRAAIGLRSVRRQEKSPLLLGRGLPRSFRCPRSLDRAVRVDGSGDREVPAPLSTLTPTLSLSGRGGRNGLSASDLRISV